ncbi:MAG: VC0807 family protein [Gordonia sp. (in: high G+C Gram-positive bacteria)]|uniref:VC0807 family protein n=1 Tax=Gordonia sp. (in: high G+C Gram-positive bacteria) TaxID=84139 RepID=UPI003C732FA4
MTAQPAPHAEGPHVRDDISESNRARESPEPKQFLLQIILDIALPLVVFYGLRAVGVGQWWALILGGAIPIIRLALGLIRRRRVELTGAFTLSMLVAGTLIGLLTGDPRILAARESYLTAVAGLWILGTLFVARPFLFTITLPLLPRETAQAWHRGWADDAACRRAMRLMTVGWGMAFSIDYAVRVVLAYTIPLDLVPVLGIALMVTMLVAVTQGTKAWAKRHVQLGA